jgi:hypothetical protein
MPKLYCALGLNDVKGKNALQIILDDTLTLPLGEGAQYRSLSAVRDALLTYEITTLLASQQNTDFFIKTGAYHPKTGKGAANGTIALMEKRLFIGDESYQVNVVYDEINQLCLQSERSDIAQSIAATISEVLNISAEKISTDHIKGEIKIKIKPSDLIAKLRQRATCYEGINVFTDDGRILLAERHEKGLASAGGHHSNKYSLKDVAYGLQSEFGLKFKNPSNLKQQVNVLSDVKTISKTGIYVISASVLEPTSEAVSNAAKYKMDVPFQADPEEFVPGSEVALTLVEMRGRRFYDVMPLAELCQYQLEVLTNYLKEYFPEEYQQIELKIDTCYDKAVGAQVIHKVPSSTFGQITLTVIGKLPEQLQCIFEEMALSPAKITLNHSVYLFDASPLAMRNAIANLSETENIIMNLSKTY